MSVGFRSYLEELVFPWAVSEGVRDVSDQSCCLQSSVLDNQKVILF